MVLSRPIYRSNYPERRRLVLEGNTGPGADEEIVEAMARLVLECLKERWTFLVRVGGWSGVGTRRVMDLVAANIPTDLKGEKGDFSGCVRVTVNSFVRSGFSPEYEIRRKVEQLLGFPLTAGNTDEDTPYWRKIAIMLKGKPLLAMVENLQRKINWDALGIPRTIRDDRGFPKNFMQLVVSELDETLMEETTWVENKFDDSSDEVAIQMFLYEACSAATEIKEKYQWMVEEMFVPFQEYDTSMTLRSLAPSAFLHQDIIDNLKGETVIDLLLYCSLFHRPCDQLLDYDKRLEINGGDGLWSLYMIIGIFRPHFLSLSSYQNAQAGIWHAYVRKLEACYIKNCNDMEYVFNSPPSKGKEIELVLETLWISSLAKLHALYNFRFEQKWSFQNLKSIHVDCCPNLLVLFPSTVLLPNLEVMEIRFCSRLGELFPMVRAGETSLPRLAKLHLCGLPKLTSICDGGHLPTLRKLEIRGCGNLRKVPLPNSDSYPATVIAIRGEEKWWKNVEGVDKDRVDFKVSSVSAAPKHIPCAWKKGVRRRRHPPN